MPGGSQAVVRVVFMRSYTNTDVTQPLSSGYVGAITPPAGSSLSSLRFQNFEVNGKYQFTPAFFVGAMYTYTHADFNATTGKLHPNYQVVGLMGDYNLSKRTDVYLQGGVPACRRRQDPNGTRRRLCSGRSGRFLEFKSARDSRSYTSQVLKTL